MSSIQVVMMRERWEHRCLLYYYSVVKFNQFLNQIVMLQNVKFNFDRTVPEMLWLIETWV